MDIVQKVLIGLMLLISFKCFSETEPYVQLLCDDKGDKITVNYFRLVDEYDSQWRSLLADTKGVTPTAWKLREFRRIKQSKEKGYWEAWVESTKEIERTCKVGSQDFNVTIGVASGNPDNLYGACGGYFEGWINISQGEKIILNHSFENGCGGNNITTKIQFFGTSQPTKLNTIKLEEHYKQ